MPSSKDKDACNFFKSNLPTALTHPNTFNWYAMASKFTDGKMKEWKEEKEEEEDLGLFDDDDDDEEASFDALCKAKQAAIDKANAKEKPIAKSIILWEVKPSDSETDLEVLAKRIKEISIEGLDWKLEHKTEPVAFGVFKLIVGAVVQDEKVSTDDIADLIEAMDDMV